jgi:hypothetical protein
MSFEISLKVPEIKALQLEKSFKSQIKAALEDAALELAEQLQNDSPVGASEELKRGWDISIASDLSLKVTNNAPNALYRIRGRKAGKMPPYGPGTELAAWAEKYGIPPYLVARSIARQGTQRYREGRNWVGIDERGKPYKGGAVDLASRELGQRLRKIRI